MAVLVEAVRSGLFVPQHQLADTLRGGIPFRAGLHCG
jgi:hypothetical protein